MNPHLIDTFIIEFTLFWWIFIVFDQFSSHLWTFITSNRSRRIEWSVFIPLNTFHHNDELSSQWLLSSQSWLFIVSMSFHQTHQFASIFITVQRWNFIAVMNFSSHYELSSHQWIFTKLMITPHLTYGHLTYRIDVCNYTFFRTSDLHLTVGQMSYIIHLFGHLAFVCSTDHTSIWWHHPVRTLLYGLQA